MIVYDGDGNRVSETVGTVTTNYLVDTVNPTGYAQVVDELQSGTVSRTYSYGLERISEAQSISGTATTSFYGYDGHGSVRQLTGSTGAVTDSYDYDAFGNLINQSGSTANNYLFAGEAYDAALGLYYNRARYLNTTTGRFWTMDAFEGDPESPISLHKYLYAAANPTNAVDPSGRDFIDVVVTAAISTGLGAAIGAGLGYYYTQSATGAKYGAIAGGFVGLTLAFGSAQQKVDVIVSGSANAAFQALANYFTEYNDDILHLPPPTQQQQDELVVQAFAAGTANATVAGPFLGLSGSAGGALAGIGNALTTAYFQGRTLKSALPSALVGAITGYIGGWIQLPGGTSAGNSSGSNGLYPVAKIITASTLKTLSTFSTPLLKAAIQEIDPKLYNFFYGP
jgi:RHS repeat-associated protein